MTNYYIDLFEFNGNCFIMLSNKFVGHPQFFIINKTQLVRCQKIDSKFWTNSKRFDDINNTDDKWHDLVILGNCFEDYKNILTLYFIR